MGGKNDVSTLLREIVNLDIQPQVFKVFVSATDHTVGFMAWVTFRKNDTNPLGLNGIDVHSDNAEKALKNLRVELLKRFGPCEHCGKYKHG